MGARVDQEVAVSAASDGKAPRTARANARCARSSTPLATSSASADSRRARSSAITQRAGVALGTFYTYFDSKEAVFQALVRDMSGQVRDHVAPAFRDATDALDGERRALESFLQFARKHRDVYRIIDEAEFVEPSAYREHYETTATRIAARLIAARDKGELSELYSDDDFDVLAWAIMGANVFLG